MKNRLIVIVAVAAALAGCAGKSTTVDFSIKHDAIIDTVKRGVRTEKIYRDLDTVLVADVFYYDPAVRRGFIDQVKAEGRITEEQSAQMSEELAKSEKSEAVFIAGVYTGDKRWNDFDKTASMWKVLLQDADGQWVEPSSIERLKLNKMQDAWLFPFLTEWKFIYRISFPLDKLAGTKAYKLRFHSVVGEAGFSWDFAQGK